MFRFYYRLVEKKKKKINAIATSEYRARALYAGTRVLGIIVATQINKLRIFARPAKVRPTPEPVRASAAVGK